MPDFGDVRVGIKVSDLWRWMATLSAVIAALFDLELKNVAYQLVEIRKEWQVIMPPVEEKPGG